MFTMKKSKSEDVKGNMMSNTFLRRLSVKPIGHNINIKTSLLPKGIAEQDILVERRLLYDFNFTVNEALAVLLILIFDD